jgi:hypothetical protein
MTRWFHPEFKTDLIDAARYYQGQRPALGAEFLDEAEQAVEEIMRAPERWAVRVGGVRRFLSFPFSLHHPLSPLWEGGPISQHPSRRPPS